MAAYDSLPRQQADLLHDLRAVHTNQFDYVRIATSDNPRGEDPLLILNDIRVGLARVGKNYDLMVDRREAIFRAILQARPGDVILIAGKGHETHQILPTGKIHFDDREVAREALDERKRLRNGGGKKNGG